MAIRSERGAAAVEMALVLPVLILLLLGIMEFGRAFNTQITLTNAARESVRVMAITKSDSDARTSAKSAAQALNPALNDPNIVITTSPSGTCTAPAEVSVTITYSLSTLTGIAGPFTMEGRSVMLCGG
ncbi:Flp pilus assembly protein TadG [Arthrobacter sp. CAN_A6]|uniref:TadE/TadG family type IV pilus assembly protein n=1 Tax=Arthrobacter sp. CAN_A6 TaxID=2787721 RepID=UPI0018C97B7A